jgi:hypothetical protein
MEAKKAIGTPKKAFKAIFCNLLNIKATKAFFQGKKAVNCNL